MSWDAIITIVILAAAALYLLRKFSRGKKDSACGCSEATGCCGGSGHGQTTGCRGLHHDGR